MQDKTWELDQLLSEKYNGQKTEGFLADAARLDAGEPLAYVIGHAPFLDTTIYLDSHPLIPRPETEYWTKKAIEHIQASEVQMPRVLDLCAGSGCIGVALLKAVPQASVDFIEINESHHPTLEKNLHQNGISRSRAHIFGGNLFERVTGTYDFILSNPPYIDATRDRVTESVKAHEPSDALYGGLGGTELLKTIIEKAPQHLSKNGVLYLEHEPEQTKYLASLARSVDLQLHTYSDQYGLQRYSQFEHA